MSDIIKDQEFKTKNCVCLYDMIIDEHKDCMYEPEPELNPLLYVDYGLDYVDSLRYDIAVYDMDEDDADIDDNYVNQYYERLCILSNEELNFGDNHGVYNRVVRVITETNIHDYTKLRDEMGVSVWSNGNVFHRNQGFVVYLKGKRIGGQGCPPMTGDIFAMLRDNLKGIFKSSAKTPILRDIELRAEIDILKENFDKVRTIIDYDRETELYS